MIANADPKANLAACDAEVRAAIARVLDSGRYILGPEVAAFEREFAAWLGAKACVTVANGTDAIELALRAVGVRPGDCVVLTPTLEAAEAACTGTYDARVRVLVPFDQTCPNGTEAYRDRQGMGTACVVRVADAGTGATT